MSTTKLDYKVGSPEERKAIVEKILSELEGPPSPSLLENLADYLKKIDQFLRRTD